MQSGPKTWPSGRFADPLPPVTTVRIFTGAALPPGAGTVFM